MSTWTKLDCEVLEGTGDIMFTLTAPPSAWSTDVQLITKAMKWIHASMMGDSGDSESSLPEQGSDLPP